MRRVVIICEGQTEREFCSTILLPYFLRQGIIINVSLIKKSMGGIVGWESLKRQIEITLVTDPEAYVTTFIDYYGLYARHAFPLWEEAEMAIDRNDRMDILEQGMFDELAERYRYRFLPYIQLHEFEGLLFIDFAHFDNNFETNEIQNIAEFNQIFQNFQNPELINNGKETAPSKRLEKYILGYKKPIFGVLIAEAIGLTNIRNKCPRFNTWLVKISDIPRVS